MKTLSRFADWRAWLRATLKHGVHNAVGALLTLLGTNGIEASTPASLQQYVEGIGLNFEQAAAVFSVTLFLSVLRSVHEVTKPGRTAPPFPP